MTVVERYSYPMVHEFYTLMRSASTPDADKLRMYEAMEDVVSPHRCRHFTFPEPNQFAPPGNSDISHLRS
jgi:hypothetical protein